jgi:hypothetical protein
MPARSIGGSSMHNPHDFKGDIRAKIDRLIRNADENAAYISVAKLSDLQKLDRDLTTVLNTMNSIKGLHK